MATPSWDALEAAFFEALEQPLHLRDAFLADAYAGQDTLIREVRAMLDATEESKALSIEQVLLQPTEPLPLPDDLGHGSTVGPYQIIMRIGQGGMGAVYLAERADEQYHQRVALKLVRPGMHSDEILTRFRMERQILAQLTHPNIARLLDGGVTDDGRPYLVMEYVEGVPITDYCDAHQLPIRDRLRLFRTVCTAVQFAHRNLVVHRDLKPSNIMVTADGRVKLLDFGIAKLLDPDAMWLTVAETRSYVRVMTPEYAAPEQVRGDAITTATDVYALGSLLYDLLTGRRPHAFAGQVNAEVERIICEEQPTRPSTAILQVSEIRRGDGRNATVTPETISTARRTPVSRLQRLLRGDLDNIVMMALRKEPERRYASAEQFGEDLDRFLQGQPVLARNDTVSYRVRKFVQRHRVGVAMAVLLLLTLVLGLAGTAWQASVAVAERDRARAEADKTAQIATFLTEVFQLADPTFSRGNDLTARELLDQGAARLETELAGQPALQAQMMQTVGEVYQSLALYDEAAELLERSLTIRERHLGPEHPDVAASLVALGSLMRQRGDLPAADSLTTAGLALYQTLEGPDHPNTARSQRQLAHVRYIGSDHRSAEVLYRNALATYAATYGNDHPTTAEVMADLAQVLQARDAFDEAETLYRTALATHRAHYGPQHTAIASDLSSLAQLLRETDRHDEAQTLLEEALVMTRALYGDEHPAVAAALNRVAGLHNEQTAFAEAIPIYEQAIAVAERTLGPDHYTTLGYHNNLISAYLYQGNFAAAKTALEALIPRAVAVLGPQHQDIASMYSNLSYAIGWLGDLEGAIALMEQVLSIERVLYGEEHTEIAQTMSDLSSLLRDVGRIDEAMVMNDDLLAMRRRLLPEGHTDIGRSLYNLGVLHSERGELAEADTLLQEALAIYRTNYAPDHLMISYALLYLGRVQMTQGNHAEAEPLLREALDIRTAKLTPSHWSLGQSKANLGAALSGLGRYEEAEPLLLEGYQVLADYDPNDAYSTEGRRWLADLYTAWGKPAEASRFQ